MAAVYSKQKLSASTSGKGILVAATSAGGTTIHTAQASSTTFDEIWLYATNLNVSSVNLTIEYGATDGTQEIKLSLPAQSGLTLIIPGLVLQGSQVMTAYASVTNKILLMGYVNRVS